MSELLKCPFCGGELVKSMWGTWEDVNENCILYGFEVHEKHLPLWNTRKPIDRVQERLEEMKIRYFLTIANTGDEKLDAVYKEVGNVIDRVTEIIKEEGMQ